MVKNSVQTKSIQEALQKVKTQNVKLKYNSLTHFAILAKQLHLMQDEKAGVPRTAYNGIVETRPNGKNFLFLIPKQKKT